MDLIFVEDSAEAAAVLRLPEAIRRSSTVVALTAEAAEASDRFGAHYVPIFVFANTHGLAAADDSLNRSVFDLAAEIDQALSAAGCSPERALVGQAYVLQYSAGAVAKRAHLMLEAIHAVNPGTIRWFDRRVDGWFFGDGYDVDPWRVLVAGLVPEWSKRHETLHCSRRIVPRLRRDLAAAAQRRARRVWQDAVRRLPSRPSTTRGAAGRLLAVGRYLYDWAPVMERLAATGTEWYQVHGAFIDARVWTYHFLPQIHRWPFGPWTRLSAPSLEVGPDERVAIAGRFQQWSERRRAAPALDVLGLDLWPALARHFEAVAIGSAALARHADDLAEQFLNRARPDALCFPSIPNLADLRLVEQARTRRIPVVSFQHGFGYGVQVQAKDELIDPGIADFFLTYGEGVQPRPESPFPARATYVPIGSTRIEQFVGASRVKPSRPRISVLWIAESSTRNVHVTAITEDTLRYDLERRCLLRLGDAAGVDVLVRPYTHAIEFDGISRFVEDAGVRTLALDTVTALPKLVTKSDLVFVLTSSPTTWAEVISTDRPMVLYCDPRQTRLVPSLLDPLDAACRWCRTPEALLDTIGEFARNPREFLARERGRVARGVFVERYVLGPPGGSAVGRAVEFTRQFLRPDATPA